MKPSIILASASPRREQLLRQIGLNVRIMPSDADESFDPAEPPHRIVSQLAQRKAAAVADRLVSKGEADGLVIAADTIVVLGGQVLGKPESRDHALGMLMELQGNSHDVITGVAVADIHSGRSIVDYRNTRVHMKPASRDMLIRYVETGEPDDKAGAYAIQGLGAVLVESIEGSYDNVVGLPMSLLCDMLARFGVRVI